MNPPPKKTVRVVIAGDEYNLRTDQTQDYTRAVAEHVDRAVQGIVGAGPVVESHKAAILAALQITDELFRERAANEELTRSLRGLGERVRGLLPTGKLRGESHG
ncbi:MAG: hypothetical protein NVS1B4_13270 [Gemmatimonadaceae bacterium]